MGDFQTLFDSTDDVFEGNVGHYEGTKKKKGKKSEKKKDKKDTKGARNKTPKGSTKETTENTRLTLGSIPDKLFSKLIIFYRKDSTKKDSKKAKDEKPNEVELKKKLSAMYGRKKKTKVVKKETKKENVQSTHDLWAHLGKANVEKAVKELCLANPKWAKVVANHNRILSRGIVLELDTLLKGMLLPMDYNNLIRQAIKKLEVTAKSSRKPSINPATTVIDVEK